jgi:ComF family protein
VRYEAPIDRWVPAFKDAAGPFGPATPVRLAIETLADELARRVAGETTQRPDLVVSIPLHPCRRRQRGFNHADPIAKRIARELNRPFSPLLLERIRDTQRQVSLVGQERRANVRGAFRSTTPLAATTHVWLVDDVLTTGSTLEAAAEALLEAGAFEVRALTLAATLPPRRAPRRKGPYSPGS